MGLTAAIAPVLSIRTLEPPVQRLSKLAATLLTSRNAISGCPPACHALPVFAVGDATAARARAAGFRHVTSASGDAAGLAQRVANSVTPADGRLFLPTARGQGMELASALRAAGFVVIRRVVYEAAPVENLPAEAKTHLLHNNVSTIMFFSAETARHFVRLLRGTGLEATLRDVDALAISDRPTVALKTLPWRRISVAAKPNQDAMLALLR